MSRGRSAHHRACAASPKAHLHNPAARPLPTTPVRCGDHRPRAPITPSRCSRTTRRPWRPVLNQACQLIAQAHVKEPQTPIVRHPISPAIRSWEASRHPRTRALSRPPATSPMLSTCRRRRMQIRQKVRQTLVRATMLVVNTVRSHNSCNQLPLTSTRTGSLRTESKTRRRFWSSMTSTWML